MISGKIKIILLLYTRVCISTTTLPRTTIQNTWNKFTAKTLRQCKKLLLTKFSSSPNTYWRAKFCCFLLYFQLCKTKAWNTEHSKVYHCVSKLATPHNFRNIGYFIPDPCSYTCHKQHLGLHPMQRIHDRKSEYNRNKNW